MDHDDEAFRIHHKQQTVESIYQTSANVRSTDVSLSNLFFPLRPHNPFLFFSIRPDSIDVHRVACYCSCRPSTMERRRKERRGEEDKDLGYSLLSFLHDKRFLLPSHTDTHTSLTILLPSNVSLAETTSSSSSSSSTHHLSIHR